MKIFLEHSTSKMIKEVPVGYSFTTLLFGFFPALFRGDWKWAGIQFVAAIVAAMVVPVVGGWIFSAIFAGFYNKLYIQDLLAQGFQPADSNSEKVLRQKSIIVNHS